jgi:hypothetical protein
LTIRFPAILENKKIRVELKKKTSDAIRLHKKYFKKPQQPSSSSNHVNGNETQYKYENSLQEVKDYYALLEESEKQHLRLAMIEERNQFCTLFRSLKPVIVSWA